jgi:adhesin transport system outer membrane protein
MTFLLKSTVAALVLLLATPAFASQDSDLSLSEAVSKGILTNPEYGVVANNRRATDSELDQARALWMPSVDFLGDVGPEWTDTRTIDSETNLRSRASLSLTQLLFDGFGTSSEIDRQEARVQSAAHRVGEVAQFVGLDIVRAYLEILRQRDLLSIASANVKDHETILATIEEGANAGTITDGDVAQAVARLAQARATEAQTREDLRRGESLFIQKTGVMPGQTLSFPDVPRDLMAPSVEDAVRKAVTKSPTLAVFEADMRVAEAEYEGSGSTLYPRITLEGSGTVSKDLGGIDSTNKGASALAVARWNLFRGGADVARQEEFRYRHAEAKERRANAARQVEKDVRDTWAAVEASRSRAEAFRMQAEANEKVVGIYKDQFTLDRRTLLDVLDSQNELFVSRSSHVNSLYAEIFGVYRLLALQSELLATLGVQDPREANEVIPVNHAPAKRPQVMGEQKPVSAMTGPAGTTSESPMPPAEIKIETE